MVLNVKVPEVPSRLVVMSFISPQDTLIKVNVQESAPLFKRNSKIQPITNAQVVLSNGTQSITIPHKQNGDYTLKANLFAIEAGKEYTLTVSDVGRKVTASCKIPASVNKTLSVEITNSPNPTQSPYIVRGTWTDNPAETNYYRTLGYVLSYQYMPNTDLTVKDTVYSKAFEFDAIHKDTDRQGGNFSVKSDLFVSSGFEDIKDRYLFLLFNTDENYFKYAQTLETATYSGDNPFAEPSPVYSNVQGGLGIFAGYQQYRLRVDR